MSPPSPPPPLLRHAFTDFLYYPLPSPHPPTPTSPPLRAKQPRQPQYKRKHLPLYVSAISTLHPPRLAWWLRRPPRHHKIQGSVPAFFFFFSSVGGFLGRVIPATDKKKKKKEKKRKKRHSSGCLPSVWRCRVGAGTGWPGVSTLGLGEIAGWVCNFYPSEAARKIV